MDAVYGLAMREDASRLYDIRRRSILELAPPTIPAAEAQAWAERVTLSGMERKLRELEVWVAELDGTVAGWGAICGDMLEGLYTAPEFAGQGVGTGLLDRLEGLMANASSRRCALRQVQTPAVSTFVAATARPARKHRKAPGPW
jgi:putative acetyltransferase